MQASLPLGSMLQSKKEKWVTTSNEKKREDSVITSRSDGVGEGSCCTSTQQTTTDTSFRSISIACVYLPILSV